MKVIISSMHLNGGIKKAFSNFAMEVEFFEDHLIFKCSGCDIMIEFAKKHEKLNQIRKPEHFVSRFDFFQWFKISSFLDLLPHQPLVIEFYLDGDILKVRITNADANF